MRQRTTSCAECSLRKRKPLRGANSENSTLRYVHGSAIGVAAAIATTQLMKSLLFGISPLDPITYLAVLVVLLTAAAIASYLPARRTAQVDPVEALRSE